MTADAASIARDVGHVVEHVTSRALEALDELTSSFDERVIGRWHDRSRFDDWRGLRAVARRENQEQQRDGSAHDTRQARGAGVLSGIGRAAAERIWYRALTVYFTSSTNYAAARQATLNATENSSEWAAVANAWAAVNVN